MKQNFDQSESFLVNFLIVVLFLSPSPLLLLLYPQDHAVLFMSERAKINPAETDTILTPRFNGAGTS